MISVIILAAGQSRRMGQPKMLLPWGNVTVIEHVVMTFSTAGLEDIVVVTGGTHAQVEKIIEHQRVRTILNPDYAAGEMLSSLQCGLRILPDQSQAALVALGDQPQVQESSIRSIREAYENGKSGLIVPSFNRKRGHPWLVARPFWTEILALRSSETLRDFLNRHAAEIQYVNLNTPTILADLDTPEDYRAAHP